MERYFLLIIILTTLTIIFTAKYFYLLHVRIITIRTLKKHQVVLADLHYSFEQIVFFHTLPSQIEAINKAKRNQFRLKYDYDEFIFIKLNGIYIEIETDDEPIILAYLPLKNFMLPFLDEKINEGTIDHPLSKKISLAKAIHPDTSKEMINEVYNQVQYGRYN